MSQTGRTFLLAQFADDAREDVLAHSPVNFEHNKETGVSQFELFFGAFDQEVRVKVDVLVIFQAEGQQLNKQVL
jgi:hypothetical protein